MNLSRTLPIAVLGLLALGACSSGDLEGTANLDNAATVAPAGEAAAAPAESSALETLCLSLLRSTNDALDPVTGGTIRQCRLDGNDPVWNELGPLVSESDYEVWRSTGESPTCDDLPDGLVEECKRLR